MKGPTASFSNGDRRLPVKSGVNGDSTKNEWLKIHRRISFEDIELALAEGKLLYRLRHPNSEQYAHQWILYVKIGEYVYSVPCVEDDERIHLITIFPTRKATARYRGTRK